MRRALFIGGLALMAVGLTACGGGGNPALVAWSHRVGVSVRVLIETQLTTVISNKTTATLLATDCKTLRASALKLRTDQPPTYNVDRVWRLLMTELATMGEACEDGTWPASVETQAANLVKRTGKKLAKAIVRTGGGTT